MRRVFIIVSLLCAGCAGNPAQPGQPSFGEPFDLRAGASATIDQGLAIIFDRVMSDSRCPMDAICVTAGDAVVAVTISQGAAGSGGRELHTDARGSEASYLAYTITLLALQPFPQSGRQIRPDDYVATLAVARK
jgi:hypothetical protein